MAKLSVISAMSGVIKGRMELARKLGITYEGKRDLFKLLGYTRSLAYEDYYLRYDRGGVAASVVDAYPNATWRQPPFLINAGSQIDEERSQFTKDFEKMAKRVKLYHYLERADKLAGLGRYSILLIGTRNGNLTSALPRIRSFDDVLYLTPYAENHANVAEYDKSPSSKRFGLPSIYDVTLGDEKTTQKVHYSRIIHVAEGLLEDEIYGKPRLKGVWNYLDDLDKVVGGSSEAVWRTVDRGIHFDIDKDADLDASDEDDFSDEIEEYVHGLKRYIRTRGVKSTSLGAEVPNIKGNFETLMALIGGTARIPVRILLGSERGQLASSSDERNFSSRVKERQKSFAEPIMIRTFIDRLGEYGLETQEYDVVWPDTSTLTDREKSDIAARYAQAIRNVSAQGEGMVVMPVEDFRKRYIDD